MGTIICLNCSQVLTEIEPLQTGAGRGDSHPYCTLEEEEEETFYRCPRCKAKNIVAEVRTASGYPQLVIVECSFDE
jgi:phage FluMu protein Com